MITRAKADQLEKLVGQFQGIHEELSALAKKSPNDGVNAFKLKFVNSALSQGNLLLDVDYRPLGDFELFNLDDVPSNSDVTFVVSQYLQAFEKFRSDNIKISEDEPFGQWIYDIPKKDGVMRAAPPLKLKR